MTKGKKSVLFLCTGNSARSQMAEVLLKYKAGETFDVYSAGTHPEDVDARTLEALALFGLEAKSIVSKHIKAFAGQAFDYVITLCDQANNECRSYPGAAKQLAWDLPDPKTRLGNNPFFVTLNELNNRLSMFLLVEEKAGRQKNNVQPGVIDTMHNQIPSFDPIAFYKSLTDDIRLKALMLTHYHGELCVCELMEALEQESQPKVSRNLAVLKKAKIITGRKHGHWVFYRINPSLPFWAKSVIAQTTENNVPLIYDSLQRLTKMKNRPNKANFCK